MRELYKLLKKFDVLTARELNRILQLAGYSEREIQRIKRKLLSKGVLTAIKVMGEWVYIVNVKKRDNP